jgi:hypothetical protein
VKRTCETRPGHDLEQGYRTRPTATIFTVGALVVGCDLESGSARDSCGLAGAAPRKMQRRSGVEKRSWHETKAIHDVGPATRRTCVSMSVGGETVKKPHLGRIWPPPSAQLWKELPRTPWTSGRDRQTGVKTQNPRRDSRLVVAWTRVQKTQKLFVEREYTNLINLLKLGVIRVYVRS